MKVSLLKGLDSVAGNLLARLMTSPEPAVGAGYPGSILIIRPGGIGDAVLLAPAINLISHRFPDAEIDILAERRNRGVFKLIPGIRNVLEYDKPADLLRSIRSSYDLVIDTEQWHRLSAVIARLTRAERIVGYSTNIRRRMFTSALPYSHDDYEALSFYRLLAPLGIVSPQQVEAPFLVLPAAAREEAASLLTSRTAAGYVVLFSGASIPERRWGTERFRQVAEGLCSEGVQVIVVGGREDFAAAEQIVSSGVGINIAGKTTLAGTAAVIAGARVLVSGDSGVLHLGAGLNVPTVSLFGPGIAAKWAPRGDRHIVLNLELDCSPCTRFGSTPPCPIAVRCLAGITVEHVLAATRSLLECKFSGLKENA